MSSRWAMAAMLLVALLLTAACEASHAVIGRRALRRMRDTERDAAFIDARNLRMAPREGIEPSSLVLIQSQAGPASRPTGERPACAGQGQG
jgi:hypothetical protein